MHSMFLCSACVYCHLKKVKLQSFSGIAIMVKLFTQLLCLFSPTISGEVTALQTLFEVTWQRIACLVSTDSLLCATNSAHGATLCLHPWALMPVGYNIGIQELGKRAVTAGSLSLCVCLWGLVGHQCHLLAGVSRSSLSIVLSASWETQDNLTE